MYGVRSARLVARASALVLVVALLFAVPAFATTPTTDTPAGDTATTPAPTPSTPAAPAAKPKPKASKPTTGSALRQPPRTGSEIDVGVSQDTEEFRKALAERQARLDEFMAQLDALDKELEVATEEYNAAVDRLNAMKENVQVAKGDLDKAQAAYAAQAVLLGDRASSLYKEGEFLAVEILLDSSSVSDFLARVKFLNTMGLRDADIAASLKGQKEFLEQRVDALKNAEADAQSLEFELKARQIEIMLRIQERQEMLASAQTDLLSLLDKEAARRKTEEQQLLYAILSGASEKGIVVQPNSPVETALAYHGVPYLWGGETPAGFDCSGLLLYVFRQHGVELPHYSGSQFQMGEKIAPSSLLPGDAVFFGSPIHHVGMYIGGGYYLHAPRTGDFVKISKLADRRDYAGGRRYPWQPRVAAPLNPVSTTAEALLRR